MKSATIPSVRVKPEVRAEIESVLKAGETLSDFVEQSVLEKARQRRNQAEFIARGMSALEEYRRTGQYFSPEEVLGGLESKLDAARKLVVERTASKGSSSGKR